MEKHAVIIDAAEYLRKHGKGKESLELRKKLRELAKYLNGEQNENQNA